MHVPDDFAMADAQGESEELRRRFKTPERSKPTKRRSDEEDEGTGHMRRRIDSPQNNAMKDGNAEDNQASMDADSPLRQWYTEGEPERADSSMGGLSEVDQKILASIIWGVDITEIDSPSRVNELAGKFGLVPGSSLDLRTGWDFELESHRRKAWKLLHTTKPYLVIGSPPCT